MTPGYGGKESTRQRARYRADVRALLILRDRSVQELVRLVPFLSAPTIRSEVRVSGHICDWYKHERGHWLALWRFGPGVDMPMPPKSPPPPRSRRSKHRQKGVRPDSYEQDADFWLHPGRKPLAAMLSLNKKTDFIRNDADIIKNKKPAWLKDEDDAPSPARGKIMPIPTWDEITATSENLATVYERIKARQG